jgi:hypothetical protein
MKQAVWLVAGVLIGATAPVVAQQGYHLPECAELRKALEDARVKLGILAYQERERLKK